MEGIYTVASSSSSSLYGNIGCGIKELILSKFPYNYFKYVNVSSELAFHNLKRQFGSNSNREITKRRMPYINIQPIYQVPEPDSFLQNVPLSRNLMDIQYGIDARYLFDVIKDYRYGYGLKFRINRDRIEYEVKITLATLHQQLDLYKALLNQLTWELPLYFKCSLESVIPRTIINYIGKLCRMDITKKKEMIPILLYHLNSISSYPITYKMRNASATDEFFLYYMHNIVVVFSDLSINEGNKKNMVDDEFSISFKVSAEFNLPGLYVITPSPHAYLTDVMIKDITPFVEGEGEVVDYIPLFTLTNLYNRYPKEKDGMVLYGNTIFTTDKSKNGDTDYINLDPIFEPEKQKVIRFYTSYNMKVSTLLNIYILKNRQELIEGEDYVFDYDKLSVKVFNSDYKATYRLIIYININSFNELAIELGNMTTKDKDKLTENKVDIEESLLESEGKSVFDIEYELDGKTIEVSGNYENTTKEAIDKYNDYYGNTRKDYGVIDDTIPTYTDEDGNTYLSGGLDFDDMEIHDE
jgi:hypothetical protein